MKYVSIMALNSEWEAPETTYYSPKYTPVPFYECTEKDFSFDDEARKRFLEYAIKPNSSGMICLDGSKSKLQGKVLDIYGKSLQLNFMFCNPAFG